MHAAQQVSQQAVQQAQPVAQQAVAQQAAAQQAQVAQPIPERDRYAEATSDLATHIGDKVMTILRKQENQERLQSILDPIVSHIINRVFPYILLSAILFLILFILTIGTFWMVMKSSPLPLPLLTGSALAVARNVISTGTTIQ
jgi:hypothetical protein